MWWGTKHALSWHFIEHTVGVDTLCGTLWVRELPSLLCLDVWFCCHHLFISFAPCTCCIESLVLLICCVKENICSPHNGWLWCFLPAHNCRIVVVCHTKLRTNNSNNNTYNEWWCVYVCVPRLLLEVSFLSVFLLLVFTSSYSDYFCILTCTNRRNVEDNASRVYFWIKQKIK